MRRLASLADLERPKGRRLATLADVQRATLREEDLQPTLLEHIALVYPRVKAYATLNGIRLTPHLRKKAKRQGMRPGIPDIYVTWPGGDGWLEVKLPRYRPSDVQPEQYEFIADQKAMGRRVAIVTSIETLDATFWLWGVPKGRAA